MQTSVEIFDGGNWSYHPNSLSMPRTRAAAVSYQGLMYIMGGVYLSTLKSTLSFDGGVYVGMPDLNIARDSPAAAVLGTTIYVAGGISSGSAASSVEVWEGIGYWKLLSTPMATGRSRFALAGFRDTLWALGGFTVAASSSVEKFDLTSWTSSTSMLTASFFHCAVTYSS